MLGKKDSITLGELRQNLLRGYARLRQAQAQGRDLEEAECVLELLGDPQVLVLEHVKYKCLLRIPLVYVASWRLESGGFIKDEIRNTQPDSTLTLHRRRREDEPDDKGASAIHAGLVRIIPKYIADNEGRGGMLLDLIWAPRPEVKDHHEITSENWAGINQLNQGPHWLLGEMESRMPEQVRKVNSLVRITFPLYPERTDFPCRMITIVLGLAIETGIVSDMLETDLRRKRVKWIRRLANVIMSDIPYLYGILKNRKPSGLVHLAAPDWLKETERDALHSAVDDLHRRIADFAGRVGAKDDWHRAENGFNFLIAFREFNHSYEACLRYRLSLLNLHALGAQNGISTVADWRKHFRSHLKAAEAQLRSLFERDYGGTRNTREMEAAYDGYVEKCERSIDEIFQGASGFEEAKRRVKEAIESSPYSLCLTPGYHVMHLNHPEIIQAWLGDPRATGFSAYPAKLLVWEATALSKDIYYSQVADGTLPIGVCGVNAEIFSTHTRFDYYELQEVIDESGPRFRYILCEEELANLKLEFRDALEKTEGPQLWEPLLDRFRRLAYYYLPSPYDYQTKLVRDSELEHFAKDRWKPVHSRKQWWELRDLGSSEHDLDILFNARHIALFEGQQDRLRSVKDGNGKAARKEDDFIRRYLQDKMGKLECSLQLRNAPLHRIKIRAVSDTSLLVLVPNPRNNDLLRNLTDRFLAQCESTYDEHLQRVKKYGHHSGETGLRRHEVFLSYNRADDPDAEEIANLLRREGIDPWLDKEILPGERWLEILAKNIETIKVSVVVIGRNGPGPWQRKEIQMFLKDDQRQKRTIIPVRLVGAPPLTDYDFLQLYQEVDYNDKEGNPNDRLIRGVKKAIDNLH